MAIQEMRVDRAEVVENPPWNVVEAAVRSLDGEQRDGLVLQGTGQSYMAVSGGENNRYAIVGHLEGCGEFICASGVEGGPAQDVVVAGDYNSFESKHVIDIETALLAAKAFFEHGLLCNDLRWEKEG
jgi:hypothetical protein